jgi:hypothetical protein
MSTLAQFDGYTLRATDALSDLEQLEKWIKADDTHRGIFEPWDFMSGILASDPRPTCYALEDSEGVVFYIRISRAARVRMQFGPENGRKHRGRVMQGLLHGMSFLEAGLSEAGVEEWIFDTDSPKLKLLAERLLGFTESTHELVRSISRPEAKNVRRPD